jgi:DNA-binding winged helix-turn-helix (wHTH) protein
LRYLFEDYVLDDARHELRRGTEVVAAEARIFDLLTYLIRNRERVVSQDDLRTAIWEGRIVSVSTVSSCMNAARATIGDNGDAQRLIRTVPRRGFRFVGDVVEEQDTAESVALSIAAAGDSTSQTLAVARRQQGVVSHTLADMSPEQPISVVIPPARTIRTTAIFAAGAGAGALGVTLLFLLWSISTTSRNMPIPRPTKMFDAAVVPLVSDETRRGLANFHLRPDFKALALSPNGHWHLVDGAQDLDGAKQRALQGCADKAKRACTIYAAGMDVLWSKETVPLVVPSDLRSRALKMPLVISEIPAVGTVVQHQIAEVYPKGLPHKALAITTLGYGWIGSLNTTGEAARVAVERCAYRYQRFCLILAVDDFLTIEVPKSRNITRIFLPSGELEMSDADKERVGRIYQGSEWRALARGNDGSWHAIADAPSEGAAIETVLKTCAQAAEQCQLYAIGNFRVADE